LRTPPADARPPHGSRRRGARWEVGGTGRASPRRAPEPSLGPPRLPLGSGSYVAMPTTALDLVSGITEYSSRIALKMLFGQFGEVTACWIPPLDSRRNERAYVKFGTTKAAQAAMDAASAGQLFLDGVPLRAEWRLTPARTQDTRDFEARGSNLMTSRDLMRAAMKDRAAGKDKRDGDRDRKTKDRDRSRSRRRRSRSKSRKRSRSKRRSRERRRSRSKPAALEDARRSEERPSSNQNDKGGGDGEDEETSCII